MSTANVARDFNAVREAIGDPKMTYLGFSYGTFLGATLQSLFPGKTRAVVLDGALDPDQYMNDPLDSLDEQTAGFERAISRFFSACAADPAACPFGGGDPRGTVDDLIEQADASPIPASDAPDRPVTATTSGRRCRRTSTRSSAGRAPAALVLLEAGDGGIRGIVDGFYGRRTTELRSGTDRYFLLGANEQNYPRGIKPFLKAGKSSYQDYDYAFWNHGYSELNWGLFPIRARDKYDGPFRTARRDPTTLVVGTRYDPATPYKEAKRLVKQLGNARLLTMTGDGHTAYDAPGGSPCSDAAIEAYLFDRTVPPRARSASRTCPRSRPPATAKSLSASGRRKGLVQRGTRPLRLP